MNITLALFYISEVQHEDDPDSSLDSFNNVSISLNRYAEEYEQPNFWWIFCQELQKEIDVKVQNVDHCGNKILQHSLF